MITVGRIPQSVEPFFHPPREYFTRPGWERFWGLGLAITLRHGATLERLARILRGSPPPTNHGEFPWRSARHESGVIRQMAWDTLKRLYRRRDRQCYFIVDDAQVLRRARKMAAVGMLHRRATNRHGRGHTILKVCLYYRGVTFPWEDWLYVKEDWLYVKKRTRQLPEDSFPQVHHPGGRGDPPTQGSPAPGVWQEAVQDVVSRQV